MVGDTTHDLAMAAAAGLRSIAVTYGVHSEARLRAGAPTWLADSFDEVLTYVRTPSRQRGGDRIAHRRAGPAG
jgi:phosphoglycolate phosphatase